MSPPFPSTVKGNGWLLVVKMALSGYGTSGTHPLPSLLGLGRFFIYRFRSTQVHRTYDNGAPGSFILSHRSL